MSEPISPPGAGEAGRAPGRFLVVLAGLSAFGPLTTDLYLPGLPGVGRSLDAGAAGVQLTLTACVIGIAVGQLLIGPLSDMLGRRRPLLGGLVAFVLASLLCAAAPSLPVLIAGRLAQGVAGAAGIVIARAMVRDLYHGVAAARTFSALGAIVTAGPIFAPIIGGVLLLVTSWRGLFVGLAAIGVALLLVAWAATKETLPAGRRRQRALSQSMQDVSLLIRHHHFMAYALAGAFGFGVFFAYIAASSFVYQDVFGLSAQTYSLLFAVNGFTLMATNIANSKLVGRFALRRLLLVGVCLLASSGIAVALAAIAGAGAVVILPLLVLVAAGTGLTIPNSVALAMEGEAARAGTASALYGLLQFGIGAVLAPLVGVAGSSAVPMGLAMAVSGLLALASYLVLTRDRAAQF